MEGEDKDWNYIYLMGFQFPFNKRHAVLDF